MAKQRKLFSIEDAVLQAPYEYSRESGARLDDLYDEALRDLLKKKGQPVSLMEALQQSARVLAELKDHGLVRKPDHGTSYIGHDEPR
jgi:NAD(P)H dehydrogenase (quinone)